MFTVVRALTAGQPQAVPMLWASAPTVAVTKPAAIVSFESVLIAVWVNGFWGEKLGSFERHKAAATLVHQGLAQDYDFMTIR
jgi:hypothetical protein